MIRGLRTVGCDGCDHAYAVPDALVGRSCPGCGVGTLSDAPTVAESAAAAGSVELLVPFASSREDLIPALDRWARGGWFRVRGLDGRALARDAVAVWWPLWLVDARGRGTFEAEVGFDYRVQSTDEVNDGGGWRTVKVERTRIRWEPRVGTVDRRYDNAVAPALRDHARLVARIGAADRADAVDFTADKLAGALVRLPDLGAAEAWPTAEVELAHRVGEDCRVAVAADHVRGVAVSAAWDQPRWTWLLVPMYATSYTDDAGETHVVLVHGRTGRIWGPRYASVGRAAMWGAAIALVALLTLTGAGLLAVVGLALWALLPVAAVVALIACALFVVALIPPLQAWRWNRGQAAG